MSDDEKYQIIGKIVSDHEAAKKHLATLKAKAKAIAEFIQLMAAALSEDAVWERAGSRFTMKKFNTQGSQTAEWPTAEALASLLDEITDTRSRIADLDQQRKELGV